MLLHSNVISRIQSVSKILGRDLLNTKLKFLVPLSIVQTLFFINPKLEVSLALSVIAQSGLCRAWLEAPNTGFLTDVVFVFKLRLAENRLQN